MIRKREIMPRKKILTQIDTWKATLLGIVSALCFYLTMCLTTISEKHKVIGGCYLFGLMTIICYYRCFSKIYSKRESGKEIIEQVYGVNTGLLITNIIIVARSCLLNIENKRFFLPLQILWIVGFLIVELGIVFERKESNRKWKNDLKYVFFQKTRSCLEHKWLIILLVLTFTLSLESFGIQFKWDGLLYYQACQDLNLYSLSSMAVYGHIAQTFGALIKVGTLLFGDLSKSMQIINIILLLSSSCTFYFLFKFLVPGKSDFIYALATSIYSFSPFLLGMVNYYSLDYFCLNFSVFLFYFAIKRQWLYFFIFSILFCFTKEPAIIIYAGVCVGIVIWDWMQDKEMRWQKRIAKTLMCKKYYIMLIPGILWFITYTILGPWSAGNGGVAVDFLYIIEKLKVLYFLNFNWIFVGIIISYFVNCVYKKSSFISMRDGWMVPVFTGQMAFTLFSCAFKTVNHPRYADCSPVVLYMIGIVCILKMKTKVRSIILSILMVLMLASSFYTLDPVSKGIFQTVNIGETIMVVPQKEAPGDGMIYNKQMLRLEQAMNLALKNAIEEERLVIFPAIGGSTYYFDGMAEVINIPVKEYGENVEHWNRDEAKRDWKVEDNTVDFTAYYVWDRWGLEELMQDWYGKNNFKSYFYLPFAGEELVEEIEKEYSVLEKKVYKYKGWSVREIIFI